MSRTAEGLYVRNGIWYIDIKSPGGERIRRSAGTKNRQAAEELRDKLKYESWRVSRLGDKPKHLWDEAALRWIKEKSKKNRSDDELENKRKWAWLNNKPCFDYNMGSERQSRILEEFEKVKNQCNS